MKLNQKIIYREIVQWLMALFIAIIIVSTLCFVYYRPTGWVLREHNATSAIWEPNTYIIKGFEGFGITIIDNNGYPNPQIGITQENLILCMGSSYTQGKEVMQNKTYVSLLNSMLTNGRNNCLEVYNLSKDAFFYPEIVSGVNAAIEEFPQTSTLIIEVGNIDFSYEILKESLIQRSFVENECGTKLYEQLSLKRKLINIIKDYFPIYSVLSNQIKLLKNEDSYLTSTEVEYESELYIKLLEESIHQICDAFDGKIIILYHPITNLYPDGSMRLEYSNNYRIFAELCVNNGISIIDLGNDFLKEYSKDYYVPYGFNNTTIGQGHFNEYGHKIIAKRLYSVLTMGE